MRFVFFPLYDSTDLHCEMDTHTRTQSFDHGTCIIQNISGAGDGLIYPWLPRWSQAMLGQASAPPVGMQAQETRWASTLRFKPFLKDSCLPTPMAGSGSMFFSQLCLGRYQSDLFLVLEVIEHIETTNKTCRKKFQILSTMPFVSFWKVRFCKWIDTAMLSHV